MASKAHRVSSIWLRKRDLFYFAFFTVHLPVILLVDLGLLYPPAFTPSLITTIRDFYIESYHDQNFIDPPGWFKGFIWMEAYYHIPLSIWAIRGLLQDDALIPLHLLIYATQTAVSTCACIADALTWDISTTQKISLGQLYVPYLLLSLFMGIDMFGRLQGRLVKEKVL
ncbi:hypothetical protein G7Y79_00066g094970 [Physcia stellaris]|nr:hypothetical protein G7Y79_00066g094970 [Physcia stellaris]